MTFLSSIKNEIYALVDTHGTIIYCSRSFIKYLGIFENSSISMIISEPEILPILSNLGSKESTESFKTSINIKLTDSSFSTFRMSIDKIVIKDDNFFLLKFESMDEKSAIEENLMLFHDTIEYSDLPIFITDDNLLVLYSTHSSEKLFKIKLEDIYKLNFLEVFKNYFYEDEKILISESVSSKNNLEFIHNLKNDTELFYYRINFYAINNIQRQQNNFLIIFQDVTEVFLKRLIEKRSEERFRKILDNIGDSLLIIMKDGEKFVIESANERYYTEFEINESTTSKNIIEEDLQFLISKTLENFSDFYNFYDFVYNSQKNSKTYYGKITSFDDPILNKKLFILSLSDISSQLIYEDKLREALEKESQLNKLKSSFLANMSHEIRTPLNAVVGFSELIEDDVRENQTNDLPRTVNNLKDSVKRLLNLVDNIVEISLIESGDYSFDLDKKDVISVLQNVLVKKEIDAKKIGVSINFSEKDKSLSMITDEIKLNRVFDIVIDNAIKFSNDNGFIDISLTESEEKINVIIKDNGIGIAEENIEKTLIPFYQEDNDLSRKYEGAGLGLTIASKLTILLGGEFNILSEKGKGTEVILTFPKANLS